jgi:hypothetical protein
MTKHESTNQAAMKDEMFITADGVGGHLEYVGTPLTVDGSILLLASRSQRDAGWI